MAIYDFSKAPCGVTITNTSNKDKKISLSGHSQSFILTAGNSVILKAKTSSELIGYLSQLQDGIKVEFPGLPTESIPNVIPEATGDTLVGEIDFNTDSTWNSEDEVYYVDTVPELDFSSVADGDVNIKITYTIDGNPTTAIGTKGSTEGVSYISSLFNPSGAIDLGGGLAIVVLDGLGENPDLIYLVATENYLSTHTVVLNSIEIDENITEILSADIDYVYDNIDTYEGTITTQTIDTTGLINEQSNIKTYWDIDDTRYIVNAMAIITGTTTSFQQNIVTDTLTITTGVLAKIIDTDGVITTEITGLTGTEVVTLLAIFVDENV
jgi:hypothetical protein